MVFIALATLTAQLLNAGLDIALIFGIDPWISPMGIKGAALATLATQGTFCLVLLGLFLRKSNRDAYGTHHWTFQPKVFWRYISPAFPRAFGRLVLFAGWAANTHIMAAKGGEYLLILTIGGTISMFLSFIGEGVLQAFVVLISNAIGAENYHRLKTFLRSGFIILLIIGGLLAIPLIFFPDTILAWFSLKETVTERLHSSLFWVWFHTVILVLNGILLSVLLSFKDTLFILFANLCTSAAGYLPAYIGMNLLNLPPDKFWLLTCLTMIFSTSLYAVRISRKKWLRQSAPAVLKQEPALGLSIET